MTASQLNTPAQRRGYRQLLKYPDGATPYEVRKGLGGNVHNGTVQNAIRQLCRKGLVKHVGSCLDPERKAHGSEPAEVYCAVELMAEAV